MEIVVAGKLFDLFFWQHLREANVAFLDIRLITRNLNALNLIFNKSFNLLFSSLLFFLRLARCLQRNIQPPLLILPLGYFVIIILRMGSVEISWVELVTFPLHDPPEVTHIKHHFEIAKNYQKKNNNFVDHKSLKLISTVIAFHLKIPIKLLVKLDYEHDKHADVLKRVDEYCFVDF